MAYTINNLPKKIYLQVLGDCKVEDNYDFKKLRSTGEITWNDDKIFENDVCYTLEQKGNIINDSDGWVKVDYDNPPKEEVLLLTSSKVILKGDWYQNNLVKGYGWRTERSQWAFAPDSKEYLTLTPKEDITHWRPLPSPPNPNQ